MAETSLIAVTEKSVAEFVQGVLPNLKNYAVRSYDQDAWAKTAMLCIVNNPDLMNCLSTNEGKSSLYHALRFAAASGLSLNPQEGESALVAPGDGKVYFWKEKNGIVRLILETGVVQSVYGDAIRENDKFRVTKGFKGDDYEHTPALKKRGEITGVYSAILEKNGIGHVYYMTREQVEEHKKKYGKGLNNPKMGWNTSWEGMAIKTAIKMGAARLSLPKSVQDAINSADLEEPIAAEWKEVAPRAEKGTGAGDLERKLEAKAPEKEIPQGSAIVDNLLNATQSAAAPAGAQEATPPAQPEIF